jgi:hypothetical protein
MAFCNILRVSPQQLNHDVNCLLAVYYCFLPISGMFLGDTNVVVRTSSVEMFLSLYLSMNRQSFFIMLQRFFKLSLLIQQDGADIIVAPILL